MKTIYEVPGVFRVTLIREVAAFEGAAPERMAFPFLIQHRVENVAAAEHVQLNDELMALYLDVSTSAAKTIMHYVSHTYRLSDGALTQLRLARDVLLPYIESSTDD